MLSVSLLMSGSLLVAAKPKAPKQKSAEFANVKLGLSHSLGS